MVIIFIHDFQSKKSCKVIVCYLAKISQLMHLTTSLKLHILMKTRQTQREPVFEKYYFISLSMKSPMELNRNSIEIFFVKSPSLTRNETGSLA